MPYNSFISRDNASALIPQETAQEVVTATAQQSAALTLCRRFSMATGQQRVPVLSTLPAAYWVEGDTGLKQTTAAAWSGVFLNAEEIACIVPIPEAVLSDATFDVWAELQEPIAQAFAQKIDAAVFSGIEAPSTWPSAIIPAAVAAGNTVVADSTVEQGGIIGDLGNALATVENEGYEPSGYAASRALRPLLRGARSTTGEPLAAAGDSFSLDAVWSLPVAYAVSGTVPLPTLAVTGDFANCAILGVRQDITFKLLDQATFVDDTGKVTLSLAQQDSVAMRVVMRLALAIAVPAALTTATTPYPFAVVEAPGGVGTTRSTSKSSKSSS